MSTSKPTTTNESKSKTNQPEKTTSQNTPQEEFNPLQGKIDEKTYAGAAARQFTPQELAADLPEPSFTPPPPEEEQDIPMPNQNGPAKKKEEKKQPETFNPDMQELPDRDKQDAAEKGAKFVLEIYKSLHGFANAQLKISDKKLNKLQMNGEIDMNVTVPYGDKGGVRFGDFVADYNSQTEEVLTVTPEFEKDVTPPLTRVLAKRGHGMTDEQYLMFAFGKDMFAKTFMFIQLKSTVNQIISFGKDQTASGGYKGPAASSAAPSYQEQAMPNDAPQASTQQEAVIIPLQDRILSQHAPVSNTSSGLPEFGNKAHMDSLSKADASTTKLTTQTAKSRLKSAKSKIKSAKEIESDVPVPGKSKRGRKLGSRNRNNKLK